MDMDFDTLLDRYAKLLVRYALNVQKGQPVVVVASLLHRKLAQKITSHAYQAGAKHVEVLFKDPYLDKCRLDASANFLADLAYVSPVMPAITEAVLEQKGAYLRLIANEAPELFKDCPPKALNQMRLSERGALKRFYEEGISKSQIQWSIAAAASPQWGKRLFPSLSEREAEHRLWQEIFRICRVDQEDYLDQWQAHGKKLQERCSKLNALQISCLHFQGPGTDLTVYLSPKAIFKGGPDLTTQGTLFEPNIPTEECFTTPDYRKTEGKVKVTRPIFVNGVLVTDLQLEFKEGKITSLQASQGQEVLQEYIQSDPQSPYLGEVALVGIDSPIFQSDLVFEEILYDENAACHIAIGSAYKFCLENGANLSDEELKSLGCNESQVHLDVMISDRNVDVHATLFDGSQKTLIQKGAWINL